MFWSKMGYEVDTLHAEEIEPLPCTSSKTISRIRVLKAVKNGVSTPVPAICIHCDSQSAIGRAQSHMYNGKSRHIRRWHNTVRQLLSNGIISIEYVKSKDNIADPLTKGLAWELIENSSREMGLKPI